MWSSSPRASAPRWDSWISRVRLDERGFAIRAGRVASADLAGLLFVGHNYDATGGLANIRRDAPLAAEAAARIVAAAPSG